MNRWTHYPDYMGSALYLLVELMRYWFQNQSSPDVPVMVCDHFWPMLPDMWRTFWSKRSLLFRPEVCYRIQPDFNVAAPIYRLIMELILIVSSPSSVSSNYKDHYNVALLLYLWSLGYAEAISTVCITHAYVLSEAIFDGDGEETRDDKIAFMKEIFPDAHILYKFSVRMREALMNEEFVDEELVGTLCLFRNVMYRCYEGVLNVTPVGPERTLLTHPKPSTVEAVAYACQRQLCRGRMPIFELYPGAACGAVQLIYFALDNPHSDDLEIAQKKAKSLALVRILSQLFVNVVTHKMDALIKPTGNAILKLVQLATDELRENHRSPFAHTIRQQMHDCWLHTLQQLQSLHLHPNDSRYIAITGWTNIGSIAGLSERAELIQFPRREASRGVIDAYTYTCHWMECLCSTMKPKHHLKVCTGCWMVYYCGSQCQESDWETHRLVCRTSRGAH
ncbi:hypothetical protein K474DRAFT_1498813 [Panus rudis PR-1116 ss-1]|nr:hypothetical protein K474DRAFT_1498813 [Panus rudis PR-1116 ss-1]